jgi:predicted PurR-regulated permease PerM
MHPERPRDVAGTTFQLLALAALIASVLWIVSPFLVATAWATTIAIATWPILLRVEVGLGGRRPLAVAVMTAALLLILVVPFYLGIAAIVEGARRVADWSKSLATLAVAEPPAWVGSVPVVGSRLVTRWRQLAAGDPQEVAARLAPFAQRAGLWFVGRVGGLGLFLVQAILTVVVVAILYSNGEAAAGGVRRFARRLAGPHGDEAVDLAARAVKAVALGVVVTAILQTALTGIGLLVVGVPFASILIAVVFVLAIAQVGPALVLIAVVVWVYARMGAVWGTGFLAWAILCSTFDNVLRPILIKRGADLPLLLIFAGVIGGLIAFGAIGLFIGPTVLAVAYALLADWVSEGDPRGAAPASAS